MTAPAVETPSPLWHTLDEVELFSHLNSGKDGLSHAESAERLEQYGANQLKQPDPVHWLWKLLEQFQDPMVYLLLIAAAIAFIFDRDDIGTPIFICIALSLNGVFGYLQERKAEKAMDSLKKLLVSNCVVVRDGTEHRITAQQLVIGDIVWLEEGQNVPADVRIIDVNRLRIDESSLTGESKTIRKETASLGENTILPDRTNMAFMGTVVNAGRGVAMVVETGMTTQLGAIASGIIDVETPKTPLEIKLESLGKFLGYVAVFSAVSLVTLHILRAFLMGKSGTELYEVIAEQFLIAVAIFVAIVPEGLPIILVITLAIGMRNMARHKAIVRRMRAVETLGSTTIICSDKTGTLTTGQMTVRRFFHDKIDYRVTGQGYDPTSGGLSLSNKPLNEEEMGELESSIGYKLMITASALCQNSNVRQINDQWQGVGDPTDTACAVFGWKLQQSVDELRKINPRLREYTFDRDRKMMSVICEIDGDRWLLTKGAFQNVVMACSRVWQSGEIVELDNSVVDSFSEGNDAMASRALRVLCFAARKILIDDNLDDVSSIESNLILLGMVGIADPPRKEVPDAIAKCQRAGIRVMMITGDHKKTAESIGREIGIMDDDMLSLTGRELMDIDDIELEGMINDISVFSRTTPDQKLRIVECLQRVGHVVAMTGDGDNDAPALSRSNIGIAMGIGGTDVARDAADMVLQDDDFSSIVEAVEEGRKIFENIRNFVRYQISTNVAAVLLILVSTFFLGWNLPLTATQLLVINILMDGPPAVALGIEPHSKDMMKQNPRPLDETLPTMRDVGLIVFLGLVMVIGTASVFHFAGGGIISQQPCTEYDGSIETTWISEFSEDGSTCDATAESAWREDAENRFALAQTSAFSTFILFQLFNVMNCRSSEESAFSIGLFKNTWITLSFILSGAFLTLLVQGAYLSVPILGIGLGELVSTIPMGADDWFIVITIATTVFIAEEMRKLLFKLNRSKFRRLE
jgi:Ca2+-transporting ATPase